MLYDTPYVISMFTFIVTQSNLVGGRNQVVTAQCARLTAVDTEVCGGMIHTTEKPLKVSIKR